MSTGVTYVLGNPASGKSTLMRLLDGHPDLAVSPVQDTLIGALTSHNSNQKITDVTNENILDIIYFRRKLSHTGYYKLEANQIGSLRTGAGASRESTGYEYLSGFDFYDFERDWVSKVNDKKAFKPNDVLMEIFYSLFSQWEDYKFNEQKCERVIGFGGEDKQNFKYILENMPNSNIIVLQRDPRGIVATRGKVGKDRIDKKLSNGKVFSYIEYHNFVEDMKTKHDDKIHIINFRDLILNAHEEMKDVAEFLNIPEEEVLRYPTFAGERLQEEYLGQINDDWRHILNEYERNVAELQMGEKEKSDASIEELITYVRSDLYYNIHPYLHLGKKGFEKLREMI